MYSTQQQGCVYTFCHQLIVDLQEEAHQRKNSNLLASPNNCGTFICGQTIIYFFQKKNPLSQPILTRGFPKMHFFLTLGQKLTSVMSYLTWTPPPNKLFLSNAYFFNVNLFSETDFHIWFCASEIQQHCSTRQWHEWDLSNDRRTAIYKFCVSNHSTICKLGNGCSKVFFMTFLVLFLIIH